MKRILIRTAAVTSLVTAMVVSGVSYVAMPKLFGANRGDDRQQMQPYDGVTLQPASYNGPQLQPAVYTGQRYQAYPTQQQRVYRPVAATQRSSAPQPVVRQDRSAGKSVLIVGGSAAAGAGIGALAGGKKGAAI